ncbi:unnamed protein product, partial [Mesorhabditis spiculigera]
MGAFLKLYFLVSLDAFLYHSLHFDWNAEWENWTKSRQIVGCEIEQIAEEFVPCSEILIWRKLSSGAVFVSKWNATELLCRLNQVHGHRLTPKIHTNLKRQCARLQVVKKVPRYFRKGPRSHAIHRIVLPASAYDLV